MAEQDKSIEGEPGEILTGERHLTEAEGKPEASEYENDDERIRGPLLPGDKSSNTEEPVYDRDPASVVEEVPEADAEGHEPVPSQGGGVDGDHRHEGEGHEGRAPRGRGQGSLPVNHPQAGYISPDLSFQDGTGILPEAEKAWHELRDKVQEEGATAVAEHEAEVAEELAEATEEADKQAQAAREAQIKKQVDAGLIAGADAERRRDRRGEAVVLRAAGYGGVVEGLPRRGLREERAWPRRSVTRTASRRSSTGTDKQPGRASSAVPATTPIDIDTWPWPDKMERTLRILKDDHDAAVDDNPFPEPGPEPEPSRSRRRSTRRAPTTRPLALTLASA